MYPAKTYRTSLKVGMYGHDVWALQINLNYLGFSLNEDGAFGPYTERVVKSFQTFHELVVDGIAGIVTQRTMALPLIRQWEDKYAVIRGLIKGIVEGESGWAVGAVNWSVPGGVDCGWTQRRVYTSSFSDSAFHDAFSGVIGFHSLAYNLYKLHYKYSRMVSSRRAWELATLAHNWPWAAEQLAEGKSLSTQPTQWVIAIGVPGVETPAQWADYYIKSKTIYVEW